MKHKFAPAAALIVFVLYQIPLPGVFAFGIPEAIPGATRNIEILGSTVTIKGLTDQVNKIFVNGRETPVQKDGSFNQDMIVPLGETEIVVRVDAPDGKSKSYQKKITAEQNHFFLAAIADGTVNFVDTSDSFNLRRDNTSFDHGTHVNGKFSYYLAGKVLGKYLIKSALDTDKATQEKLFTNIDPDKYYPVYGDNSTVVYDVHSQGKFYLRVDWDESGVVVGNFQTQSDSEEEQRLAAYNRTLYGAKAHLETPNRTVYGEAQSKVSGFFAEANQLRGHSELLATGGSLYYLRHRNVVEGSEQVRLEVRDKNSHAVLYSVPQRENLDYEIKYDEGRILFKRPVTSVALSDTIITDSVQEGNEIFVVANYEYTSQDAFPILSDDFDTVTGGVRGSHSIGDNVRVGGTYVQEEKDGAQHKMTGVNSTLRLGNFTKVDAEYAETRADSTRSYLSYNGGYDYTELLTANGTRGTALKVGFNTSIGEYFGQGKEWMDVSGYFQTIDKNFSPVDSLFESGTKKAGLEVAHRFTEDDRVRFIYEDSQIDDAIGSINQSAVNDLKAMRTQNFTGQWVHNWDSFAFTTEYRSQSKKDSLSTVEDPGKFNEGTGHVIAEQISYKWSDKTDLFVGQQIGLDERKDSLTTAGISHQITSDLTLHARGAAGDERSGVLAGLEQQVDPRTTRYMNYVSNHSAVDGKTSSTVFGTNTRISDKSELRRENQLVTSDVRGVYQSELSSLRHEITPRWDVEGSYERREEAFDESLRGSTPRDAVSATTSYTRPDFLKAFGKFEFRNDTGGEWQVLSDTQGEWKVTRDFYLFGEHEYSQGMDEVRDLTLSRIDKKQIGIAFRPVDFDWLNGLFKYIRLQDDRPRDITSADGGFLKQKSTYDEFAGEFAVDLPWHLQWVEKAVYREEDLMAVDVNNIIETPQNIRAYLVIHRLNHHLTDFFDLAAEFRMLRLEGSDVNSLEYGPLVEFIFKVHKNIGIGAGYNFTSFKEDLTELDKKKAEGFFIRLQGTY